MALSGGNVDDIFAVVGKILHLDEISSSNRSTLVTYKADLENQLDTDLATEAVNIYPEFVNFDFNSGLYEDVSRIWIDRLFQSYPVIWDNLNLSGFIDARTIAGYILRELIALSESVSANAFSIGSITYTLGTANAFSILTDLTLDGAIQPADWMQASIYHDGMTSQCGIDEDLEFVADSLNPSFLSWRGKGELNLNTSRFPNLSAGSGRVSFAHANSLIPEIGEFDEVPSGWELIDDVAAGGAFVAEDSDTHGAEYAIKITGDGAEASLEIRFDVAASILPRKRYCLVCFVKGNGSLSAGTLTIAPIATGWSGPSGIVMNQAALAAQTSYGIESTFFTTPADFYEDFSISVKLNGTPSAHAIRVAKLYLVPVEYVNCAGVVPVQGAVDVVQGDRALVPFENDYASDWQTRYPRKVGLQLPSSGSPTIAASLIA